MITTSVVVVALMFSVYAWLASIEFGIALLRLWPKLDAGKLVNRLFTPLWEVTNVFLVFGFTGFSILFNNALVTVAHDVLSTLIVGIVALLLRAMSVLYLFYYKPERQGLTIANGLFGLTSFVVPMSFAAVGVYLLIGQVFWLTVTGWTFMALAASLLIALGLAFIYWRSGNQASARLQWACRISIAVFAAIAAVITQLVVRHDAPHLLSVPFAVFVLLVACTLLWQGALFTTKRADHGMWWYLSLIAWATPLLLAFANMPWLVYGQYLLTQAYGADAYAPGVIIGLAAIFPIMLTGWLLLVVLLSKPSRNTPSDPTK